MIPADEMPTPQERLGLYEVARDMFVADGHREIGIDHFALPSDGLARAAAQGRLRRNFQGYTDDTSQVLIGLGASSISRFPQGFAQNVSGTADYAKAIRAGRFATCRGHSFKGHDLMRARIIEALMCDFRVARSEIDPEGQVLLAEAAADFPGMVTLDDQAFDILPHARPLTRVIARRFDEYQATQAQHSAAI